jgi:hypothetical protein
MSDASDADEWLMEQFDTLMSGVEIHLDPVLPQTISPAAGFCVAHSTRENLTRVGDTEWFAEALERAGS